jgi:protein TonB
MELISMRELTYPTLPISDLFAVKPTSRTLWRWLFISLTLHVLIVLGWELLHFSQIMAQLPIQSGQQAVSMQLVSASATPQKQTPVDEPTVITTKNISSETIAQSKIKVATASKTATKKEAATASSTHQNNADDSVSIATNLAEGVFSEATPQSSHKPEYPRLAILKNQQGKVVIKLDIDEQGQTHNIQLLKSSGFALLDKTVIAFAQVERFIPANRNNTPVKTTQQYSFLFKLI